MNEEKHFDYASVIDGTDLSMQVQSFINKHKTIKPGDWIVLNRLVKQLNKQKYSESRKVLRSMRNRFEAIQNKYQRER